ncbi:isoprenylcysteine carboxylmethyltransferase family protein [Variovorax sp. J2P1-59]|uniref:methyltransferase family protein n=1 Tax=Variovorax flavidus TaxID=3053501 RepID=UPI0025756C03|nr:isoprenylcysteine carboxylmethyltransferase family protein [Variovorax sp. J2P1-59]MDM0073709.1 isoprenylcysteine carboxylmethyltransferase family protein [Variovorax sp. J2P1-59]
MLLPLAAYAPTFVVVSSVLLYASRGAIRRPRSHGFSRFFAWECILGLIWINLPVWGTDPLALRRSVAQVLLIIAIWLPLHAVYLLIRLGHRGEARQDEALLGFERTSTLVTAGAFRYIRHPMYTSLICLAWGTFLQQFTWMGLALVLMATALLFVTAIREEEECLAYFGDAYHDYMRRTRRFVPFLL